MGRCLRIAIVALLVFAPHPACAWLTALAGSATSSEDVARHVAVDSTGNLIVVGTVEDVQVGRATIVAVKLSRLSGGLLWRTNIDGDSPGRRDRANAVALDRDGHVFVAGTIGLDRSSFVVVKLDGSSGAELWRHFVTGPDPTRGSALGLALDSQGNPIAVGYTGRSDEGTDFTVVKLDSVRGAELWRATPAAVTPGGSGANAVVLDEEDNAVVAGALSDDQTGIGLFSVVKLDNSGEELWRTATATQGIASLVGLDGDGNVFAAGSSGSILAAKFSRASGAETWRRPAPSGSTLASGLVVDSAGDVLLEGIFEEPEGPKRLLKLSGVDGAPEWATLPRCNDVDLEIGALVVTGDGDLLVGGTMPQQIIPPDVRMGIFTVSRLDRAGESKWCYTLPGTAPGGDRVRDIAVVADKVYAVGHVARTGRGTSDFVAVALDGSSGSETWTSFIDGKATSTPDIARAVALDSQENVLSTGEIRNVDTGRDLAIVKLEPNGGVVLWKTLIDGTAHGDDDVGLAIAVDAAGNAIVAGALGNADTAADYSVIKVDGGDGGERWRTSIDGTAGANDLARALTVDTSGDVISGGRLTNHETDLDFSVVKLDGRTGRELWQRSIDGGAKGQDMVLAVVATPSRDVIAAGITCPADAQTDFTVLKLDGNDGETLWSYSLLGGEAGQAQATSVTLDDDGNVVAAGTARRDGPTELTVVKLDAAQGRELWRRAIRGSLAITPKGPQVVIVPGGGIVVGGVQDNLASFADFVAARFDGTLGDLVWERAFDRSGNGNDALASLTLSSAGDLILSGAAYTANLIDFSLARLSSETGQPSWWREINGSNPEMALYDAGYAAVADRTGNVVGAGTTDNAGTGADYTVVKLRGVDGWDFRPLACVGDCNLDQSVKASEQREAVEIALGSRSLETCVPADPSSDALVTADELVVGTLAALNACSISRGQGQR